MTGTFLFLFCVGIFANDALAFPTEGPPGPKPIQDPNHCLLLTPDREAQVEVAVDRITQFIHSLTVELELIDLKYLNVVVDGHYDNETEDREMVLELTVNSCPRTEVKVADEAKDADDGVKDGEVDGEQEEHHKDLSDDGNERDDGDNNEDIKVTDHLEKHLGEADHYDGTKQYEESDANGMRRREEDTKIENEDDVREEEIKQLHQHKNNHGHEPLDDETLINNEHDNIHLYNRHPHKDESVEEGKVNDEEAKDQSNLSHHQHRGHHSQAETDNDDVDKKGTKYNPVETHHHRAYHHHTHHDDKQVQIEAQASEIEDASNTEINEDVTKPQKDTKEEINENKVETFVNSSKNSDITGSGLDDIPKPCYCTEIQPQALPQKQPISSIEHTLEERDGFKETIEFKQDVVPALFNLQLPDNGVELLKDVSKKTGNGPILVYVQNWDDVKSRQYVIFSR